MRRLLLCATVALFSAGCNFLPTRSTSPVVPPTLAEEKPRLIVPDDVTTENAYEKLKALQQELDRDLEGEEF